MITTVIVDFLAGGLIAGVAFIAGIRAGRKRMPQRSDLQRLRDEIERLYDDIHDGDAA